MQGGPARELSKTKQIDLIRNQQGRIPGPHNFDEEVITLNSVVWPSYS